jgi:radical SAM protein with 4Fe4S-binding SPASM domain
MNCIYCRANAKPISYENELTTKEYFDLLDDISEHFNSIIILTGGDPMERKDIFQIVEHCTKLGLYVVLSSCGHSLSKENLLKLKDAGVLRVSLTLNGVQKQTHEEISGRDGSFDEAMRAIELCKQVDMSFQIHTAVLRRNVKDLPSILELAKKLGSSGYHPFFFVPVGRGIAVEDQSLPPDEYEKLLNWLYEKRLELDTHYEKDSVSFLDKFILRPSCAPHFSRIVFQRSKELKTSNGKDFSFEEIFSGCMAGRTFIHISNTGQVQPCGELEIDCGNIKVENFSTIWETSKTLEELKDRTKYKGKCGVCNYVKICGGCRARAYIKTGDYLAEDPYCIYKPTKLKI